MPQLIGIEEARDILGLRDDGDDELIKSLLEGVTSVIEHEVGAVSERDVVMDIRQGGYDVVLPESNVLSLISGEDSRSGSAVDVTGMEVVEGGILCAVSGQLLPASPWKLTVRVGMDPIPEAIRRAATETLKEAYSIRYNDSPSEAHTRPFLISYRTMVWLEPFRDEAGFA